MINPHLRPADLHESNKIIDEQTELLFIDYFFFVLQELGIARRNTHISIPRGPVWIYYDYFLIGACRTMMTAVYRSTLK